MTRDIETEILNMSREIDEKFIVGVSIHDYVDVFTKSFVNKVLLFDDCTTLDDAFEVLVNEVFSARFRLNKMCFMIVFEIAESFENQEFEELDEIYDIAKPVIISFESKRESKSNTILVKEANERSFKKILQCDKLATESFEDGLNVSFDLEILLKALQLKNDGSFNGKLLETLVNFQQSFGDVRLIEHAAFNNNILCLRFLRLFEFDLRTKSDENKKILKIAARSCDFQGFLALLDLPFDCNMATFLQAIESLEALHAENTKHFNLLMIASESGNSEAVNFLVKCSHDINQQHDLYETAAALAWSKENYEIFVKLLKENSLFPRNFHEKLFARRDRGKVKNVLMFINDMNLLHENIRRGRIDQVRGKVE